MRVRIITAFNNFALRQIDKMHARIEKMEQARHNILDKAIHKSYAEHTKADNIFRRALESAEEVEQIARNMRLTASERLTDSVRSIDGKLEHLFALKGEQYQGMIVTSEPALGTPKARTVPGVDQDCTSCKFGLPDAEQFERGDHVAECNKCYKVPYNHPDHAWEAK